MRHVPSGRPPKEDKLTYEQAITAIRTVMGQSDDWGADTLMDIQDILTNTESPHNPDIPWQECQHCLDRQMELTELAEDESAAQEESDFELYVRYGWEG